jgi:hypothetical protein
LNNQQKDIYTLPSRVLLGVGICDLLRGIAHTFLLNYSASHVAKFDLATVPMDQVFMLGVFGMSNFVTGFINILVAIKAREISPQVLLLIPLAYLIGLVGVRLNGVHADATFNGRYMMFVYFAICGLTYLIFLIQKRKIKT